MSNENAAWFVNHALYAMRDRTHELITQLDSRKTNDVGDTVTLLERISQRVDNATDLIKSIGHVTADNEEALVGLVNQVTCLLGLPATDGQLPNCEDGLMNFLVNEQMASQLRNHEKLRDDKKQLNVLYSLLDNVRVFR